MTALKNNIRIHHLSSKDIDTMRSLLGLFGDVFNEAETYCANQPDVDYLRRLLGNDSFISLVASSSGQVVGGLVAYELEKFEQERREIYIYDLAVAVEFRRRGIATALIQTLKEIVAERGAYVIFVQADKGDTPAISLYGKLGIREDVVHFDIPVKE